MVCFKVSVALALLISFFLNVVDLGAAANCTVMTNCKTCLDYNETKCFWCSSTEKCIKKDGILPKCKSVDWRYFGNCTVAGYVWVIVLPVLGLLILVALGCCFYCCCCTCKQNALKQDAEEKKFRDKKKQRRDEHAERRARREEKNEEIRQKYGISKKGDPV